MCARDNRVMLITRGHFTAGEQKLKATKAWKFAIVYELFHLLSAFCEGNIDWINKCKLVTLQNNKYIYPYL